MKYREASKLCSKGCGRERAKGQRLCPEHRALAERERRERRKAEFRELVAFKAAAVAEQIARFNEGTGGAG